MSNLDNFKTFVKSNPSLINYVRNDKMTWQKFYEMYDLYGESDSVWSDYLNPTVEKATTAATSFDLANWLKNIDVDSFQEGINSVKRVISVLQDFGTKDSNNSSSNYKPRPLYKHFED